MSKITKNIGVTFGVLCCVLIILFLTYLKDCYPKENKGDIAAMGVFAIIIVSTILSLTVLIIINKLKKRNQNRANSAI
ncbi:MAG: hypothetical protein LBU62_11600 [Bacteroidales bacterium]|jgi:uncharacterized membrane protein YcjF (UPF0283 family)|nr:hypothetical protein [Bacteroidales bacterium]